MNLNDAIDSREYEQEIKDQIKEELGKLDAHAQTIMDRVDKMQLIHENLVVVEKIDIRSMKSFLQFVEKTRFDSLRLSFYGKVLKISDVPSGCEIGENKKKLVKIGDIISFNPDSAYSLNVIVPEDLPEIWILCIDNVLLIDNGFDIRLAKEKAIETNILIQKMKEKQMADNLKSQERNLKQMQDMKLRGEIN